MSFEFLLDPFTEFHCRGTVRHSLKSIQQRLESLIDPCAGACGVKFLKHSVQMAARCVCVVFEWKAHDFRTHITRDQLLNSDHVSAAVAGGLHRLAAGALVVQRHDLDLRPVGPRQTHVLDCDFEVFHTPSYCREHATKLWPKTKRLNTRE